MSDNHHLASRYRQHELNAQAQAQLARIHLETGQDPLLPDPRVRAGDRKRLRGIPVVGFGGDMDESNPAEIAEGGGFDQGAWQPPAVPARKPRQRNVRTP